MTVRDALKETGAAEGLLIMYRRIVPVPYGGKVGESDELIGYCRCKGGKLVPEDYDSYYMDEKIDRYELACDKEEGNYLVVWECKADLEIPVSEPWFSMRKSGKKKEDYREIKPYWYSRFCRIFSFVKNTNIPFEREWDRHWIRFRNGYGKARPSLMAEVTLHRDTSRPEWGAKEGKEYYVLKIHNIYEENAQAD